MAEENQGSSDLEKRIREFNEQIKKLRGSFSRQDMLRPNLVACASCKELYPAKMKRLTGEYCLECYKEKAFGIIPEGTVRLGGGSPSYVMDDDSSPWGENAKRSMEGD